MRPVSILPCSVCRGCCLPAAAVVHKMHSFYSVLATICVCLWVPFTCRVFLRSCLLHVNTLSILHLVGVVGVQAHSNYKSNGVT